MYWKSMENWCYDIIIYVLGNEYYFLIVLKILWKVLYLRV